MIDRLQSLNVPSSNRQSTRVDDLISGDIPGKIEQIPGELNTDTFNKEKVEGVVKGLNDFLGPTHTSLKFELHEKLNEYYVTLVDDQTKEVVREIPSKKMLDFYAAMTDFIGLMIDKKI